MAADSCVNWEQGWTAASSFPGGRDLVADISGPTETGPARRELLPRIRSQAQRSSRRCRPKRIHQPMLVSRFWRVSCSNLHVIRRSLRPTRISPLARVLVVGRASNVSQHRARPHPAGIGGSQGTDQWPRRRRRPARPEADDPAITHAEIQDRPPVSVSNPPAHSRCSARVEPPKLAVASGQGIAPFTRSTCSELGSTSTTLPSKTRLFLGRLKTPRKDAAISPGSSNPFATW